MDHALPICIHVRYWICRLGYAIVCTWGLLLRHVDGPLEFDLIIPLKKSTIQFSIPMWAFKSLNSQYFSMDHFPRDLQPSLSPLKILGNDYQT